MDKRQENVLQLLEKSGDQLHRLLMRITMREDIVGDLMQELFIKLSNSRGFGKAENPFAYAWRVAVNLAFEWRRRQKIKFCTLVEDPPASENRFSPLDEMVRRENIDLVLDATARLSHRAQEVVVMHYIEQESYEKIAERLGKQPQSIRALCSKTLARIRGSLKSNDNC